VDRLRHEVGRLGGAHGRRGHLAHRQQEAEQQHQHAGQHERLVDFPAAAAQALARGAGAVAGFHRQIGGAGRIAGQEDEHLGGVESWKFRIV
jgi:hypothetical protein